MKYQLGRWRGCVAKLSILGGLVLAVGGPDARAQGPADVEEPIGLPEGRAKLGPVIGDAGILEAGNAPGTQDNRPMNGRLGASGSRAPVDALNPSRPAGVTPPPPRFRPETLEPATVPHYGELELPTTDRERPSGSGLTLDAAIDGLIRNNLNLTALRFEIPMAQADALTAGLRTNPVVYADAQLVPYGKYSNLRPGGPPQYDINITYPLDVTRKRKARMIVAEKATRVTQAQFQDAIRLQIDNLYTAYVDVAAAEETLRYSKAYRDGITRLLTLNQELLKSGQVVKSTIDALHSQAEQAQLQVHEATHAVSKTGRTMARLLNLSRADGESIRVEEPLRILAELPHSGESLVQLAMANRPDLIGYRIGVERAGAEIGLAHANRLSDVYVLAQPYTFQDNRPFGFKSPHSWAVGVTVPLPIYNRNQGNIQRAKINATQTQVELGALEREIADEVDESFREFQLSRNALLELEREVIPASRRVRDSAYRRLQGGESSAIEYLDAQKDYNEVVRQYRDTLVRHRRAMLDLNTAVGVRVLP
ncbi:TolC family protein [Singulisphaera acidiphila]|uniref:Outer membrane protein n=1 Tax=Singulisphaera acidiphila (strain ATCC BAA-1392 / DSM 18658 / VKM B-2454 / MOB10) TaxID=886293 RepID=L0DPI3_SINAD|nr:TolC family protein [Singulisphaera acidiphila]AGA31279.1 outer membrane protein [Singulisphaera acidiphila DSM 18658]